MTNTTPLQTVAAIAAIMLVVALLPLPYGYYQLLRVIVFAAGIYTVAVTLQRREIAIAAAVIVLLFNPLVPVHLSRGIWAVIDLAAAGFFGFVFLKVRPAT